MVELWQCWPTIDVLSHPSHYPVHPPTPPRNGWLIFFLFHVNQPSHSWDRPISDPDLESQGHGCDQRAKSYNQPSFLLIRFLFISHQSDQQPWDTAISIFYPETSKVKVMSGVKGQGNILHPVSNRCTSFSLHISRTNFSLDMAKNSVWPWKNISKNFKENLPK